MFAYRRIMVTPVLALLAAGLVTAQEPPREPAAGPQRQPGQLMPGMDMMGPRAEMGWEMLAGAMAFQPARLIGRRAMLQLTPEQVSRLEALSQEAARARTQADSVGRLQADQLRELWNAPAPDVAQLRSRAQAAMQARQAGALAGLEAAAKAKAAEMGVTDKTGANKLMGMLMKDLKGRADGNDVKAVVDGMFA